MDGTLAIKTVKRRLSSRRMLRMLVKESMEMSIMMKRKTRKDKDRRMLKRHHNSLQQLMKSIMMKRSLQKRFQNRILFRQSKQLPHSHNLHKGQTSMAKNIMMKKNRLSRHLLNNLQHKPWFSYLNKRVSLQIKNKMRNLYRLRRKESITTRKNPRMQSSPQFRQNRQLS